MKHASTSTNYVAFTKQVKVASTGTNYASFTKQVKVERENKPALNLKSMKIVGFEQTWTLWACICQGNFMLKNSQSENT